MKKIKAFLLGLWEFRSCVTWADPARGDDGDLTPLDEAYDCGREFAHVVTFRRWDE